MPQSFAVLPGAFLLLLGLAGLPHPATAQQPTDSIRAAALRDYHGPDLEGKDGPLAKVGLDLLLLYHEYKASQEHDGDTTFTPSTSEYQVTDGFVTIDAVATETARALRADLKALGLKDAATAGRIVSGQFPLNRIPALADVESLRSVVPAQMETRSDRVRPSPTPLRPSPDTSAAPDSEKTPPDDSTQALPPDTAQTGSEESAAEDNATIGTGETLIVLSVLAGLLGLFFFFRR